MRQSLLIFIIFNCLSIFSAEALASICEGSVVKKNKISDAELDKILKGHRLWVTSSFASGARAILCDVNLSGRKINNQNLSYAILINADLSSSDLTNSILRGAILQHANLTNAKLMNVDFSNIVSSKAILTLIRKVLVLPNNIDLANGSKLEIQSRENVLYSKNHETNLALANLSGAILTNADFKGANLANARLDSAELSLATFVNAIMIEASLSKAEVFQTNFKNSDLTKANLNNLTSPKGGWLNIGSGFPITLGKLNSPRVIFEGANLRESLLVDADLHKSLLLNSNFLDADLTNANISESDLKKANLKGANLSGVNFQNSDLRHSKLLNVKLENADLGNANVGFALYEPLTSPKKSTVSNISGVSDMQFGKNGQSGIVLLRSVFREFGLRQLEREATYAIEHQINIQRRESNDLFRNIEGYLNYTFFELTCKYGLEPSRLWILIILFILLFTFVYSAVIVWQYWLKGDNLYNSTNGIWMVWPEDRISMPSDPEEGVNQRLVKDGWRTFFFGFYFSLLSAFHIGWRDLNVGSWLSRMQGREYGLRATGWIRTISGLQSLFSIYCLALWVLVYFGSPFQ